MVQTKKQKNPAVDSPVGLSDWFLTFGAADVSGSSADRCLDHLHDMQFAIYTKPRGSVFKVYHSSVWSSLFFFCGMSNFSSAPAMLPAHLVPLILPPALRRLPYIYSTFGILTPVPSRSHYRDVPAESRGKMELSRGSWQWKWDKNPRRRRWERRCLQHCCFCDFLSFHPAILSPVGLRLHGPPPLCSNLSKKKNTNCEQTRCQVFFFFFYSSGSKTLRWFGRKVKDANELRDRPDRIGYSYRSVLQECPPGVSQIRILDFQELLLNLHPIGLKCKTNIYLKNSTFSFTFRLKMKNDFLLENNVCLSKHRLEGHMWPRHHRK